MMKKLWVAALSIPTILSGQQVTVSRLGDNASNQATSIEASANVLKLKTVRATDKFGTSNSPKVLLSFADDTSGIRTTYDIGLGMLSTETINSVYPIGKFTATLPHTWNTKHPFSVGATAGYAPLDDIARFSRANVGVGTFTGTGEVFVKQKLWLHTTQDYRMFTDSNRRLASTANVRYFNSNGIIYGAQLYKQTFKFDANTTETTGYWSPRTYRSQTVELGYKRPWNAKITGQIIASTGWQQMSKDNSPIASIQSDIHMGPISVWGNYSSNGAVSGLKGYRWWTTGATLKF